MTAGLLSPGHAAVIAHTLDRLPDTVADQPADQPRDRPAEWPGADAADRPGDQPAEWPRADLAGAADAGPAGTAGTAGQVGTVGTVAGQVEAALVEAAARLDPARLRRVGERILAHLDPDGAALASLTAQSGAGPL